MYKIKNAKSSDPRHYRQWWNAVFGNKYMHTELHDCIYDIYMHNVIYYRATVFSIYNFSCKLYFLKKKGVVKHFFGQALSLIFASQTLDQGNISWNLLIKWVWMVLYKLNSVIEVIQFSILIKSEVFKQLHKKT